MKKYLFLIALWFAFLAPDLARAASRFGICATICTWDNTSTTMWSASSGGATGASAPVAGDDVTLDAATCTGGTTCTITTFSGTISFSTVTWGACTASTTGCVIDASVNNTNFTGVNSSGGIPFNGSGTGTRQWKAGTGTYALTSNNGNPCLSMATTTNSTGTVFSGATWTCSGATSQLRNWNGGGLSYGPTTFNTNSSFGVTQISGSNTFASLTFGAPHYVWMAAGATNTITGALAVTGSSSTALTAIMSQDPSSVSTISLGSASTPSWISFRAITTSGAAALTSINCFDYKLNTFANGGSCTAPSVGGGGGGRIIGG